MSRPAIGILITAVENVPTLSGWQAGPLPVDWPYGVIGREQRETYFESRIAARIYDEHRRSWRAAPAWPEADDIATPRVIEMLLTGAEDAPGSAALIVIHVELRGPDPVAAMHALVGLGPAGLPDGPGRLRPYIERIVPGCTFATSRARAFGIALETTDADRAPVIPGRVGEGWSPEEEELFRLASSTPAGGPVGFPLHPAARDEVLESFVPLSQDWEALVLRDGAGFRGLRAPTEDPRDFFRFAEAYVRTIYLDVFLVGEVQRDWLARLADDVAAVGDPTRAPKQLAALEHELTTFRNTFGWQHVTRHGHASDLLAAYRRQHRLDELGDQVTEKLKDFNEQIRTEAATRQSVALERLAYLGLPFAIALPVGAALEVGPWGERVSIIVAVLVVAAIANEKGWLDVPTDDA